MRINLWRAATGLAIGISLGCSSSSDGGGAGAGGSGSDAGADGAPNQPPTLVAPAEVSLQQGRSMAVALSVSDPEGQDVQVEVQAPSGLEATVDDGELQLVADYTLSGPLSLPVTLRDEGGGAGEANISLEVAPVTWTTATEWAAADGPEAREHGAFIVDAARKRVLLLGGSGYDPYLDPLSDVWSLDLESYTWTRIDVPGLPAGGSRRVAMVPGSTVALAFGGYGAGGAEDNELIRIDYSAEIPVVTTLQQTNPPPARSLHAFIYDPERDEFFLFGGVGLSLFNDTWRMQLEGDTAVWTPVVIDERPSRRYGFFYGFDAEAGLLTVFSGAQGTAQIDAASDTWQLDTRSEPPAWRLVDAGEGAPAGRRNGCFAFDPQGPRLFVFGGTADAQTTEEGLFVFDTRASASRGWTELSLSGAPAVRSSGFGFYDPVNDRIVCGFGNTSSAVFRDLTPIGY